MPPRPAPLPPSLAGAPFTVADATAAGVTRARTRASDLEAPFYGIRTPAGERTLLDECRARALRLPPHAVFSHLTAARLHSLPLPHRFASSTLHVTVTKGHRAPEGRRTAGHQCELGPDDADARTGVRATTPARTFCDLAAILPLPALVAIGDHLIRRDGGLLTRSELAAAAEAWPGRRGLRRLRLAMELLDEGAESPKESELRVLLVERGFPVPVCNERVFDEAHRFVARVDLAYPDLRIAIEYEGDHHRDRDQWRRDLQRRRRLEALGWTYLSVTQADLDDPRALVRDLRAAVSRAGR